MDDCPEQCDLPKPSLAYHEAGQGETMLLLHGSAGSSDL
jgi:hypothetical protein